MIQLKFVNTRTSIIFGTYSTTISVKYGLTSLCYIFFLGLKNYQKIIGRGVMEKYKQRSRFAAGSVVHSLVIF
jgi:hypothetical protein